MFLSRETGISGNFVGRIKGAKGPFDRQFLPALATVCVKAPSSIFQPRDGCSLSQHHMEQKSLQLSPANPQAQERGHKTVVFSHHVSGGCVMKQQRGETGRIHTLVGLVLGKSHK